ncbi:hypothetical protein BGLA2_1720062 [Burkholderia gladioli]|nr:hypothetical protein BGLA2_1720062 [Burkholderia gladioli]
MRMHLRLSMAFAIMHSSHRHWQTYRPKRNAL